MRTLLFIPWFKLEPWYIPVPGIGEIPIQPFGVLVAIGVLFGARVAERFGKRNGVAPSVVADLVAHVVMTGFIFAIVLNAVFYTPEVFSQIARDPFQLRWLGLSSYGGFIGAVVGGILWRRRRGMSLLAVGDAVAFGFPFGWLFGRTGCFVVHDHPGLVTDFPLAVDAYRIGDPPLLPLAPRHDLGFYEVLWSAAVIALFLFLARTRRKRGFYVPLLALTYAPVRFFLDFLRAEAEQGGDVRYLGLTPGHYASLLLLVVGVAVYVWIDRNPELPIPPEASWPPPDESGPVAPGDGTEKPRAT